MHPLKEISINVRRLVETVLISGSLPEIAPSAASSVAGIKVHQKYQQRGLEGYKAEVRLKKIFSGEYVSLIVTGKADGIYTDKQGIPHLEEIKSIVPDPDTLTDTAYPLHWAQIFFYGWFYCLDKELEEVCLDLIYYSRPLEKEKIFSKKFNTAQLEAECMPLVQTYLHWQDRLEERRSDLNSRIREMAFPFDDFRKGQRHFSKISYRTIRDGKVTFIQAPTGTGKTMAALFGGLKALGEGYCSKLFFLTARNSGAIAVSQALFFVNQQQIGVSWVLITAKAKICFMLDGQDSPGIPPCSDASCPYAKNYFDKLPSALETFFEQNNFDRTAIERIARRHQVCPFELSLDLALNCEVIVADYNYAFDYLASLKRFFRQGKTRYTLFIDEAHNIVERTRDMFSGTINKNQLLKVRRQAPAQEKKILSALNAFLLDLRKQYGPGVSSSLAECPENLEKKVNEVIDKLNTLLERNIKLSPDTLSYYQHLYFLKLVCEQYDEKYRTLVETGTADISISLICIDPAKQIQHVLKNQQAAVFFSATLQPGRYFLELTAPDREPEFHEIASPFPAANSLHIINPSVSTRWKHRDRMLPVYTQIAAEIIAAVPGNKIIYSPSFGFQEKLVNSLQSADETGVVRDNRFFIQRPGMTARERETFIARFSDRGLNTTGFCVIGGSFAESIDLPGEKLSGVIIFGVGLPQINLYTKTIGEYFEQKPGDGYHYAFTYPGINRVLQAAGRVIRSSEDKGFIYLIDDRYSTPLYRQLLPVHWQPVFEKDQQVIISRIKKLLQYPAACVQPD